MRLGIILFSALIVSTLTLQPAHADAPSPTVAIDPADYPELSDKEIGHVRRIVQLSRQLPGDWSGMSDDLWVIAERTQQFQLAYMAAALGLVQHSYTPAYRELYRQAMDDLIQKLTLPDIWESWLNSSRSGTTYNDPDMEDLGEGWIDPIRKHNAMLKAYLLQASAMYEMLYRDGRYEKPGAFTFKYEPRTWGNGPVVFRYTLTDLAKIVYQEYVDSHYEGIQCEPNRVFPACNQPPILGLMNYDQVNGTHYAEDVMPKFAAAWVRKGYTNRVTGQNAQFIYVKQDRLQQPGSPVLDSWAGVWMHAWNPELAQSIYPAQRKLYLKDFLNGSYAKNAPPPGPGQGNRALISAGFGQFAFMAAELGDDVAREKLLEYAEKNFNPVWDQGAYYYPRNDDYQPDAGGNSHGVATWTGNVLVALARLDKGGAFRELYLKPWGKNELESPQIVDVDNLVANVSQAWYDSEKSALIVTLKPGPVKTPSTSFNVRGLDSNVAYSITKDHRLLGHVRRGESAADDQITWHDGSVLSVSTDLDTPHTFIISADRQVACAQCEPTGRDAGAPQLPRSRTKGSGALVQ